MNSGTKVNINSWIVRDKRNSQFLKQFLTSRDMGAIPVYFHNVERSIWLDNHFCSRPAWDPTSTQSNRVIKIERLPPPRDDNQPSFLGIGDIQDIISPMHQNFSLANFKVFFFKLNGCYPNQSSTKGSGWVWMGFYVLRPKMSISILIRFLWKCFFFNQCFLQRDSWAIPEWEVCENGSEH